MRCIHSAIALLCTASLATGFVVPNAAPGQAVKKVDIPINARAQFEGEVTRRSELIVAQAMKDGMDNDDNAPGFFSDININPPYALAYVLFLGFAYLRQSSEVEGASMEVIQQFIADPLNPGFNELFLTIFNLLGLFFVPFACLLQPGAKGQKFPATPFILGSMFGGYGVLGLYTSTRVENPSQVTKADLGWVTANILENKLFNWFIVILFASAYINSGFGAIFTDPSGVIQGYLDVFSETAIASASSLDFLILTLAAASFVPEDLSRRGYEGGLSKEAIAASTCLAPGVGIALYCALRPSLAEE